MRICVHFGWCCSVTVVTYANLYTTMCLNISYIQSTFAWAFIREFLCIGWSIKIPSVLLRQAVVNKVHRRSTANIEKTTGNSRPIEYIRQHFFVFLTIFQLFYFYCWIPRNNHKTFFSTKMTFIYIIYMIKRHQHFLHWW